MGRSEGTPLTNGYTRMFPSLPALAVGREELRALAECMTEVRNVADNPNLPSGYTYFGQFIAHDLSRMRGTVNRHRPLLDLENLYGRPGKYKHRNLPFLETARGANLHGLQSPESDLPRTDDGKPDIPDPRNDLHTIISQLHLAFARLHNRLVRESGTSAPGMSASVAFAAIRREVSRLYQWLIVNDFLRRLCDEHVMLRLWPAPNQLAPDFKRDRSGTGVPLEFALAAFRFGHSMARPTYRLNDAMPARPIFRDTGEKYWYADLRGHRKLLVKWSVQWDFFLGTGECTSQCARRITPHVTRSLSRLPAFAIEEEPRQVVNIAERTLAAGNGALPSGQDVARIVLGEIFPRLGLQPREILSPDRAEPLWYYILKEADVLANGLRLGPVGSWIVISTIAGALLDDKSSFVHAKSWSPTLPATGQKLELADLIRCSGLPFTKREWEQYVAA